MPVGRDGLTSCSTDSVPVRLHIMRMVARSKRFRVISSPNAVDNGGGGEEAVLPSVQPHHLPVHLTSE